MRNHLLKSPFIVHPKSCRFCCPIDPESLSDFDPFSVPYLDEVFQDEKSCGTWGWWSWLVATYKGYVEMFRTKFLRPLHKDTKNEKAIENARQANNELDFWLVCFCTDSFLLIVVTVSQKKVQIVEFDNSTLLRKEHSQGKWTWRWVSKTNLWKKSASRWVHGESKVLWFVFLL